MRVVVVTILILATFFVSAFMLNRYIDSSCEKLLDDIDGIRISVENNKWDSAKEQFESFKDDLENTKKKWQLFLEHYEMDAVDITIAKLGQYIDIEERVSALGEVAELKLLVSHIRDKEQLKLENIL